MASSTSAPATRASSAPSTRGAAGRCGRSRSGPPPSRHQPLSTAPCWPRPTTAPFASTALRHRRADLPYGSPHASGGHPPPGPPAGRVVPRGSLRDHVLVRTTAQEDRTMTRKLHSLRRVLSDLVAEDRAGFRRVDASAVQYDDGSW